jgi:hypothetical protein
MGSAPPRYIDLTKEVESVRPDDLDVPPEIVSLVAYVVPMLLDAVHRKEALPPLLILKRENDRDYMIEPIEEELRCVEDLLAYTRRRMQNDMKEDDSRGDGFNGTVLPMPIVAYAAAYDERNPIFTTTPEPQMVLHVVMGCSTCARGIAVSQTYRPRLFGGAVLVNPPVIETGPDSFINILPISKPFGNDVLGEGTSFNREIPR